MPWNVLASLWEEEGNDNGGGGAGQLGSALCHIPANPPFCLWST